MATEETGSWWADYSATQSANVPARTTSDASNGAEEIQKMKSITKNQVPNFIGEAITSTEADINRTDITTEGTAEASKVLTSDSNKDTTGIRNLSATQVDATTLKQGGTAIASTFAPIATPTFTGAVTLAQAPTADLHAATKAYVDGSLKVQKTVQITSSPWTVPNDVDSVELLMVGGGGGGGGSGSASVSGGGGGGGEVIHRHVSVTAGGSVTVQIGAGGAGGAAGGSNSGSAGTDSEFGTWVARGGGGGGGAHGGDGGNGGGVGANVAGGGGGGAGGTAMVPHEDTTDFTSGKPGGGGFQGGKASSSFSVNMSHGGAGYMGLGGGGGGGNGNSDNVGEGGPGAGNGGDSSVGGNGTDGTGGGGGGAEGNFAGGDGGDGCIYVTYFTST